MRFARQVGIFDPQLHEDKGVSIIGCGSVGSFSALIAGKMGVKIDKLYDSDIVEDHNIPNQFFPLDSIGNKKTEVLQKLLKEFADVETNVGDNITANDILSSPIVLSAVDSMPARQVIWEVVKESPAVNKYIDTRMGGQTFMIYVINPKDEESVKYYEEQLHPSEEAEQIPCTQRTIIYNVGALASFVSNYIVKICNEMPVPKETIFNYNGMILFKSD